MDSNLHQRRGVTGYKHARVKLDIKQVGHRVLEDSAIRSVDAVEARFGVGILGFQLNALGGGLKPDKDFQGGAPGACTAMSN
ncbi:hypothetical protein D3C75_1299380 [compost metagenome]